MTRCPTCSRDVRLLKSLTELSPREAEVYKMLVKGMTNKAIGEKLFVTDKTIKFHVTAILKKKQAKTRFQLIRQEAEKTSILNKVPLEL